MYGLKPFGPILRTHYFAYVLGLRFVIFAPFGLSYESSDDIFGASCFIYWNILGILIRQLDIMPGLSFNKTPIIQSIIRLAFRLWHLYGVSAYHG